MDVDDKKNDSLTRDSQDRVDVDGGEKSDFVKKIESFDVKNLSPENIDFVNNVIQDYFLENFPVDPELVKQIPEHVSVLTEEEYKKMQKNLDKAEINLDEHPGFFDRKRNRVFINSDWHANMGSLVSDMFHESLHYVSINAGAGFASPFSYSPEIEERQDLKDKINRGVNTLIEGTTEYIAHSEVRRMGFDVGSYGYFPEVILVNAIYTPFSIDEMKQLYFQTSMEDLRIKIEKTFGSDETRNDIGPERSNGIFVECLANIGIAVDNLAIALGSWEGDDDSEEILRDVKHAVGFYILKDLEVSDQELDAKMQNALREYIDLSNEEEPPEEDEYSEDFF